MKKGPFLAKSLYREFFKNLDPDAWRAETIRNSHGLRNRLREDWLFSPGQVKDEIHQEGLIKFVTELADGNRVESVILPMKTHQTVCISSQAGLQDGLPVLRNRKTGIGAQSQRGRNRGPGLQGQAKVWPKAT